MSYPLTTFVADKDLEAKVAAVMALLCENIHDPVSPLVPRAIAYLRSDEVQQYRERVAVSFECDPSSRMINAHLSHAQFRYRTEYLAAREAFLHPEPVPARKSPDYAPLEETAQMEIEF